MTDRAYDRNLRGQKFLRLLRNEFYSGLICLLEIPIQIGNIITTVLGRKRKYKIKQAFDLQSLFKVEFNFQIK